MPVWVCRPGGRGWRISAMSSCSRAASGRGTGRPAPVSDGGLQKQECKDFAHTHTHTCVHTCIYTNYAHAHRIHAYTQACTHIPVTHTCVNRASLGDPPPQGPAAKCKKILRCKKIWAGWKKICWLTPPSRPHSGLARAGSNWDRKSKLQKCQL